MQKESHSAAAPKSCQVPKVTAMAPQMAPVTGGFPATAYGKAPQMAPVTYQATAKLRVWMLMWAIPWKTYHVGMVYSMKMLILDDLG